MSDASQPGPTADAGWYRDPGDADQERYWDGTQWTGLRRDPSTARRNRTGILVLIVCTLLLVLAPALYLTLTNEPDVAAESVEADIAATVLEESEHEITADCPTLEWKPGETFECVLTWRTSGGAYGLAEVTMGDDEGEWTFRLL